MITLNLKHALTSRQAEALLKAVIVYANKNNWGTVKTGYMRFMVLDPQFHGDDPWMIAQAALNEAGLALRLAAIDEVQPKYIPTEAIR